MSRDADAPGEGEGAIVSWQAAARNIPGGAEGVLKIAAMLAEECPGWLAQIRRGIADGDTEGVRRAAHTLRGAALHFEAGLVTAAAGEVEAAAQAGDLAAARRALPRLEAASARLVRALADRARGAEREGTAE